MDCNTKWIASRSRHGCNYGIRSGVDNRYVIATAIVRDVGTRAGTIQDNTDRLGRNRDRRSNRIRSCIEYQQH